jgi:hypothetical protein
VAGLALAVVVFLLLILGVTAASDQRFKNGTKLIQIRLPLGGMQEA